MPYTTTSIPTLEAARITKRLCQHWKHKFEISEKDGISKIPFPDAVVTLQPQSNALTVSIEGSIDETQLEQYKGVVVAHIERMANEKFDVEWLARE